MKNKVEIKFRGKKRIGFPTIGILVNALLIGVFGLLNPTYGQVIWQSVGNDPNPAIRIGSVMIGNAQNPVGSNLQVHSSNASSHINISGTGPSIKFTSGYNTSINMVLGLATASNQLFSNTVATDFNMVNLTTTGSLILGTNNTERFRILPNGNIGIGVLAPAYKLDVNGTIKSTGFLLPTGAGLNKILVSDASGNATWQTFSTVSTNAWPNAANGKVLMSDASGNPSWQSITAASINGWQMSGNAVGSNDYIGTTNANPLVFKSNNIEGFRVATSGTVGINIGNISSGLNSNFDFHKFIVYGHTNFVGRSDALQISSPILGGNGARHYISFSNLMFPSTSTQYGYIGVSESLDSSNILQSKHLIMQAPSGANVGIGTTTIAPTEKLTVYGNGLYTGSLKATNITLTTGAGVGKVLTSDANGAATWQPVDFTSAWKPSGNNGTNPTTDFIGTTDATDLVIRTSNVARMKITSDGNVAIGTNTIPTGYSLAVNGKVIATEVFVRSYQKWPDYVFAKNYKLMTLNEVESYINKNQHLPGLPAASEVEKNGIGVGQMETVLVEKVEQLTLYAIDQDKTIESQQSKIEEQQLKIDQLILLLQEQNKRIEKLEAK